MRTAHRRLFVASSRVSTFAFSVIAFSALATRPGVGQAAGADEAQIRNLQRSYVLSVDRADVALASQIWSHQPGVTFIHPLGTDHGFDQIAADIYLGIMGRLFSTRDLVMHDPAIHIYGDSAWSEMTWTFHATRKDGVAVTTEGRESQFYHKEQGAWRIVLVHYSGPPVKMPDAAAGF
jgi:ketosteroid isomerase-like protein